MGRIPSFQRAQRVACVALVGIVAARAALAQSNVRADFNGDGFTDLAVGVLFEDAGRVPSVGAVNVLYGSPAGGLSAAANQLWHQERGGIADSIEPFDEFGFALMP
jgi:hypothetical protein